MPLIIGLSKDNIHFGVNMLELWKPLFVLEHENMWVLKSCYGNYVAMKDVATSKFHVYVNVISVKFKDQKKKLIIHIHTYTKLTIARCWTYCANNSFKMSKTFNHEDMEI